MVTVCLVPDWIEKLLGYQLAAMYWVSQNS